jgi:hypothetical protein
MSEVTTILFEDGIIEVFIDKIAAEERLRDLDFHPKGEAIWEDGVGIQAQITVGVEVKGALTKKGKPIKRHYQKNGTVACNHPEPRLITVNKNEVTCGNCKKFLAVV